MKGKVCGDFCEFTLDKGHFITGDYMTQRKIALSIEEAADYTGIGRNTLRQLVEWKKLPVLKVGRKVLIKTDILEMFMEANEGRDLRDRGNVKAVTRTAAN